MEGVILPYHGIHPTIAPDAFIAGDRRRHRRCRHWRPGQPVVGTVVRGDVHEIRIGARTNIQDGSVVHVTRRKFGCYIGSDVTVGHGVILHGCILEDGCFIGMGATVMDGARVESGAMVAAGALVTPGKVVARGELWSGSPARPMRPLKPDELAMFAVTAANYVALAEEYR